MYKLQMFDSKWLKFVGVVRRYWGIFFAFAFILSFGTEGKLPALLSLLYTFMVLFGFGAFYFYSLSHSLQHLFMKANDLDLYFSKGRNIWSNVGPQYKSMKRSTFMNSKDYGIYGESLVGCGLNDGQLVPLAFIKDSGCVGWVKLGREFPHLVVDSLKDNHSFRRMLQKNNLPREQVTLEGDFPESFKVYQEPNQQILTLQILSPDRMSFLAHDIKNINLEIQDNYLRLYAANAQRSAQDFKQFLDALNMLQKGLKTARVSAIK
jgi:hypothetical protein